MERCAAQTEDIQQEQEATLAEIDERSFENPGYLISGSSARALFLAWFFCTFIPALDGLSPLSFDQTFYARIAFLIAAVCALILGRFLLSGFSNTIRTRTLSIVGILCAPLAAAGSFFDVSFPMLLVFWCASGIGLSCLSLLDLDFSSTLEHSSLIFSTAACYAVAAIVSCIVVFIMPASLRFIVFGLMPLLAIALFFINRKAHGNQSFEASIAESKLRMRMSWKSAAAVIAHSMCLGFAAFLITTISSEEFFWGLLIVSGAVCAMCVIAAIEGAWGSGRLLDEGAQLRFTVFFAMVGMLPLFSFSIVGVVASCCVLVMAFVLQSITSDNAISENIRLDKLNTLYVGAPAFSESFAGLAIGYACGFLFLFVRDTCDKTMSLAVIFVMLVVIAFLSSMLFRNRYPSVLEEEESQLFEQDSQDFSEKRIGWKERCDAYSSSIGLSPRQKDVFLLLVRGHNANYIERKLVISKHTVKSHVYSIYQKAQVHSKQELIEKVESFDPSS